MIDKKRPSTMVRSCSKTNSITNKILDFCNEKKTKTEWMEDVRKENMKDKKLKTR